MDERNFNDYNIWQPLLLSLVMIIGMVIGYKMNDADDPALIMGIDKDESVALSATGRVEEIVRFIESRYVDEVNDDALIESAITTVLDQLDPHSLYIAPKFMKSIHDTMEGKFKGVGIESYYLDDTVNVISVMPDSPADKAQIRPFDKIIAINDSTVAGIGLEFSQVSEMLRADDSDKRVSLLRYDTKTRDEIELGVAEIPINSIETAYMINDDTGIIKILRFSSQTYKEFMEALEEMKENKSLKNLIIDLRDNPGGYLPETTNILSQLMREKDRLLVYTEGKAKNKTEYKTTGKSFFDIDKIAVLIDENSASGSEILAGAIQDWDRGLILGRRTFGKGLVQEQYDLSNGGAIRLTVARYYTPTGRSIQQSYEDLDAYNDITNRYEVNDTINMPDSLKFQTLMLNRTVYGGGGITPDIYIPMNEEELEPELEPIMTLLPEWVYRKIRSHQLAIDLDQSPELYSVSDDLMVEFQAYLKGKVLGDGSSMMVQHDELIKKKIIAIYIKLLNGAQAYYKYVNSTDDLVLKALDYTSNTLSLKDYLIKE